MNSNKKSNAGSGVPPSFNRQAGSVGQLPPRVAQFKTRVAAQSIKRPIAPPVHRPTANPQGVQAKTAILSQLKNHPVTRPAYDPQPVPRVLQTKKAVNQQAGQRQQQYKPVAPPVYRPQTVPKVLQTKRSPRQSTEERQAPRRPVVLPDYRPEQKRVAQTKIVSPTQQRALPKAPPVYCQQTRLVVAHPPGAVSLQMQKKKGRFEYRVIFFGNKTPEELGKGQDIDLKTVAHAGVYFPAMDSFFEWGRESHNVSENEGLTDQLNREIWSYESRDWIGTTREDGLTGMSEAEIRAFSAKWARLQAQENKTAYPWNCRGFAEKLVAQLRRKSS